MTSTLRVARSRIAAISRREWLVLAALFLLFFIAFRWAPHLWIIDRLIGTDLHFYYLTWDEYSASLVFGRLEQNQIGGVFSDTMSLGLDGGYTRQFGLGGWLLTLPATAVGQFGAVGVAITVSLAAAFNAVLATAAVRAIRRTISLGAAVLVTIGILQPWSVSIARNAYWLIGLKLLAATALILLFAWQRDSARRIFLVSIVLTTIACLSGYEMYTLVAASQLAVVAYYSMQRRWPLRTTMRTVLVTAGGILGGFVTALCLHLIQLYLRTGDMTRIDELLRSVSTRTGAMESDAVDSTADALAASPASVLDTYLAMPVFGVRTSLPILRNFTVGAFLLMVVVVIVIGFAARHPSARRLNEQSMGVAWIVSLLGVFGWLLLARPHSYMHTFIVFAMWFLPAIPLGLGLLWDPLRRGADVLRGRPVAVFWLVLTLGALILGYLYSLASVRP